MEKLFLGPAIILLFGIVSCSNVKKATLSADNNSSQRQKNINTDNELLKVFETGNVSTLDSIIAPDFVNHTGMGDRIGIDSLKAMVKSFHSHVNNLKMEVKRQWADDDYVADWIRFTGTNPTLVIEGIEVTRFSNGKAIEHWFFPNSQTRRNQ